MLEVTFRLFDIRLAAQRISKSKHRLKLSHFALAPDSLVCASREKLDCDYVTIISVVIIIRYGYTPLDNYELGCSARRDAKPRIGTRIR